MTAAGDDFTIGVEEEYQIVDPASRALRARVGRVLPEARRLVGDEVTTELYQSQIEVGTPVCRTLAEVRAALARLRRELIDAARAGGTEIAAAGTHPFSRWEDQKLTPRGRYRGIAFDFQQLAREQIIFGCHVHIGIQDRELAIRVMNRLRPWLAPLTALAANSPFWQGVDTGYESYRTELFERFPTVHVPHVFASRAEYDRLVADLVATGSIEDASKLYWDVRPSSHVETLEFRVADVCTRVDEAVMIAGLCRALVRRCAGDEARGAPIEHARPELLRVARWHAARHGLEADLIDPDARRAVPARERVDQLLAFARPALEEAGDWDEVADLVDATFARGTGAARQRAALAERGRMEDIVDRIVAETSLGTDP